MQASSPSGTTREMRPTARRSTCTGRSSSTAPRRRTRTTRRGRRRTTSARRRSATPTSAAAPTPTRLRRATRKDGRAALSHPPVISARSLRALCLFRAKCAEAAGSYEPAVPLREPFERGGDERRQRVEVVAAFEDGGRAWRERTTAPAELAETSLGHVLPRGGIPLVCVDPRRHDDELRIEALHRRRDRVVERAEVLLVSRARGHGHVERRLALLLRCAGAGIERPLVQRDEEHGVVVPEDVLRSVSVVDVEVDDRDAFGPGRLCSASRDCDVVEQAEAHRVTLRCMVSGRAHERERLVARGLDRDSGGEEC